MSSSTDPEARFIHVPAGEMRPVNNAELFTDTESRIFVGVDLSNDIDQGQMDPMLDDVHTNYCKYPNEHLVDGGFVTTVDLEVALRKGVVVYAPVPKPG